MTEFKIGDRVRVYGATYAYQCAVGAVTVINADGTLHVATGLRSQPLIESAHPKQCRKLIKRPRRRAWLLFRKETMVSLAHTCNKPSPEWASVDQTIIEFIEVKKK